MPTAATPEASDSVARPAVVDSAVLVSESSTLSAQPPVDASTIPDAEVLETSTLGTRDHAAPSSTNETAPTAQPVAVEDVSFSFTKMTTQKKLARRLHPVRTPRSLLNRTKGRRKPLRGFSSFGASLAEAQLRAEDPRADERRVGDSDLDWGDDSDADPVEELSNGIGDMEIDPDLDERAMASFVKSMSAEGSRTVTMDDIADAERIRQEDEEDGSEESDGEEVDESSDEEDSEVEEVVRMEEEILIAEGQEVVFSEDEEPSSSSEDEDDSPRRGFQARLQRIRENAKGKGKAKATQPPDSDEEDDDFEMNLDQSWADDDEDFIAHIQVCTVTLLPLLC